MKYSELTVAELKALEAELKELYQETAKKKLNIDVTRGKPSEEQLKLADGMFTVDFGDFKSESGADVAKLGDSVAVVMIREGEDGNALIRGSGRQFRRVARSVAGGRVNMEVNEHGVWRFSDWRRVRPSGCRPSPGAARACRIRR